MALGGLWHGAGLTFLIWGMAHGIGLGVGVLWHRAGLRMPAVLGWVLTMGFFSLCLVLFRSPTFEASLRMYQALAGFAPLGDEFRWRSIVVAALIATLGPTAWAAIHRLPPWRSVAVGFAVLFVLVLFKIGDEASYEFIYFQF
jgi:D-alanyl-lipoteichoic acid acyltransferase DltB (MBOAT superfamily)